MSPAPRTARGDTRRPRGRDTAARPGCVQVFARAPVPGQTKTRLIPALGAVGAAALHAQLLQRTLGLMHRSDAFLPDPHGAPELELWCAPDQTHPVFAACQAKFAARLYTQQGADLGARMAHALHSALSTRPWALVVGSDCPGLLSADLALAVQALDAGSDAVLGPAADGGYYLLGLRCPAPALFTHMPWGTDRVLSLTRARLRQLGWRWQELPQRHDLDEPEDLLHFPGLVPSPSVQPA